MLFPAVHSLVGRNSHSCAAAVQAPAGYCISRDQQRQHQPCCWPWAVNTFPEPFQPSRACSPALEGSQPMSSPSWVVSSVLAGAPSCPCTHAKPRPLQSLNSRGQSIPEGSFPPKTCAVSLWEQQPPGLVLLSDMIFRITVFCFSMLIIMFHTKVDFPLQPDYDLVLKWLSFFIYRSSKKETQPFPMQLKPY